MITFLMVVFVGLLILGISLGLYYWLSWISGQCKTSKLTKIHNARKTSISIGTRLRKVQHFDNPFEEPVVYEIEITDIKNNNKGFLWYQYKHVGNPKHTERCFASKIIEDLEWEIVSN